MTGRRVAETQASEPTRSGRREREARAVRPRVVVLKIGGSLLTRKSGYCEPDVDALRSFAQALQAVWELRKGGLVLIVGGGSYGNGIPRRYRLCDPAEEPRAADLMRMTAGMFEWLTEVCRHLRERGLPAYPFQASGYSVIGRSGRVSLFGEPILRASALGLLPVLAGDLVFDEDGGFAIVSSDCLPEALMDHMEVERVLFLTDVPGVQRRSSSAGTIAEVTRANHREVLRECGPADVPDVTGGMRAKLEVALRLARRGVDSAICDGRDPSVVADWTRDPATAAKARGTLVRSWDAEEGGRSC